MFASHHISADAADQTPVLGEAKLRWLRATPQLDLMHLHLSDVVQDAVAFKTSERDKAIALHDLVKSLPFGCTPDYSVMKASDILAAGQGDCFTKGMLFVAMLRCAKIPARLRFVSLPVAFLRGIADVGEPTIMHAMAEVLIEDRWRVTDSYVPDAPLQLAARAQLQFDGHRLGYGVHLLGDMHWDGLRDASAQCSAVDPSSLPVVDWGVADDPESFYAETNHEKLRRNFATRLIWRLAAPVVNKRVAALREASPLAQSAALQAGVSLRDA